MLCVAEQEQVCTVLTFWQKIKDKPDGTHRASKRPNDLTQFVGKQKSKMAAEEANRLTLLGEGSTAAAAAEAKQEEEKFCTCTAFLY